ncbi:hypothetical protein [Streptomyces sp. NPDC046909]|uniref:hypothetical protein n=1 Tax=Streptomyces sp. NPDC046909 TaxID=3155617 RepID=UPI0033ECE7A8
MPIGLPRRTASLAVTVLLLSLAWAPATAALAVGGEGVLPGSRICLFAQRPVAPLPGFEGLYEQYYNDAQGCALLKNTSGDRVLMMSGTGTIDGPSRLDNTSSGWIRETTAQAAIKRWGSPAVVILPGESVSLYDTVPPASYYIWVADPPVTQAAKVSEGLANAAVSAALSQNKPWNALLIRTNMREVINACAAAADSTWREIRKSQGDESLSDVLLEMTNLSPCKAAYNAIDPNYVNPEKPAWYRTLLDDASRYADDWWRQYRSDVSKAGQALLNLFRRV